MAVRNAYLEIVEMLLERIQSGELKQGDALPSEKALMEMTGIGRSTVRKGLAVLVNDGYIHAVQGKGYYVRAEKSHDFRLYFNETSTIETSADSISIINVDIIVPSEDLVRELNLTPNRKVVVIKRMITDGETRIALDCKYIPYSAKSPVVEKELYNATFPQMFTKEKALFDIIKNLKISVDRTDEEMAKILRTREGSPVVRIEQKLYDENKNPIGFGVTRFLGQYFKIKAISE